MDISFFKNVIPTSGFSFLKKPQVIGVDIGSASVKIVQLRLENEKAILETYGELATGPYTGGKVGQAGKLNDTKASEVISDVVRETGATARDAVIGIPLRNSFVTLVEMPNLTDTELQEAMQYEARRYIPIPVSEVTVDWWRLPEEQQPRADGQANIKQHMAKVLLVAVPKDLVDKYKRIVTGAGLNPKAFEIETFSVSRSIISRERSGVLLIDFGAITTKMTILDKGIIRASHSFDKGLQDVTIALTQSMGVDFERAETMKRDIGLSTLPEHQNILKVMSPLVDFILIEIERFSIGYSRRYGVPISKMYIAGGGASLKGLVDHMVKKFGVEILVGNPFAKVDYPAFFQPVLREIGPSFAVSVGLALRGLK